MAPEGGSTSPHPFPIPRHLLFGQLPWNDLQPLGVFQQEARKYHVLWNTNCTASHRKQPLVTFCRPACLRSCPSPPGTHFLIKGSAGPRQSCLYLALRSREGKTSKSGLSGDKILYMWVLRVVKSPRASTELQGFFLQILLLIYDNVIDKSHSYLSQSDSFNQILIEPLSCARRWGHWIEKTTEPFSDS